MEPQSRFTIVVVDDDADEICAARGMVTQAGIDGDFICDRPVETLTSDLCELAMCHPQAGRLVVLLDADTPRRDGLATLREIRSVYCLRDLPVIMLSASDSEADVAEAFDLGANGYLMKPFRRDEFFGTLAGLAAA